MASDSESRLELRATGAECAGFLITRWLLTVFTCGIYGFWLASDWKRWIAARTWVHGSPLVYRSSFADFVLSLIVRGGLQAVTCGLYAPWALVKGARYDWRHTTVADGRTCRFDGDGGGYIGTLLGGVLLTLFTCGLGSPWANSMMVRWNWSHTLIGGERVRFDGRVGDYLLSAIGGHFLCMLTLGIYLPWHLINLQRWRIENACVARGSNRTTTEPDPIERVIEARARDPKTWIALGGVIAAIVVTVLLLGALSWAVDTGGRLWEDFQRSGTASSQALPSGAPVAASGGSPGAVTAPRAVPSASASASPVEKVKTGVALQPTDLSQQSCDNLWVLRNWVYARHGYAFTTQRARSYFGTSPDYHRNAAVTDKTVTRYLTPTDTANRNLIQQKESAKGCK